MNEVKFTIITPSYNQGKYIENTIKSVINQNYQNWELLIQDGASTDSTIDVCTKYLNDKRVKLTSEKDKGFADAVNKGILKAEGEWILILNSDDFLAKDNILSFINAVIIDYPSVKLITGNSESIDFDNNRITNSKNDSLNKITFIDPINVLSFKETFSQSSTFFCCDRVRKIGLLDKDLDMVADTDLWIRYILIEPNLLNQALRVSENLSFVTVHNLQRSYKPQHFFTSRAKMAIKHFNNENITIDKDIKYNNAINQINQSIEYFIFKSLDNKENVKLYEKFSGRIFPIKRKLKYLVSFLPLAKLYFYKNFKMVYKYQTINEINNILWF